jgi:uncharacterized protein YbjT (DUF2867 family)
MHRPTLSRRRLLAAGLALLATGALPTPRRQAHAGISPADRTAPSGGAVLVFGGTGRLGAAIVRALLAAGFEVAVFARPESDRERLAGLPVTFVVGDALVDDDVRRALEARRYRIVVNALGRSESPPSFFAATGTSIAKWSKAGGVEQVILHSSVGVGDSRDALGPVRSPLLSAVFDAKETAEQALVASGVRYTIIRHARLQDPRGGPPETPRLVADPRAVGTVSRRGLAKLTVQCAAHPRCYDLTFTAVDDALAGY